MLAVGQKLWGDGEVSEFRMNEQDVKQVCSWSVDGFLRVIFFMVFSVLVCFLKRERI